MRYSWDGEMVTDSLAAGSSAAALPMLRNGNGFSRITSYSYDARGKMLSMTNTIGLAEQMAVSYSPMGSLRQSAYESQSYNLSLNIFTLYGYQWSRTLETDSSDALGNVLTRNVIAYTGSAQSPTLIDVPPRLFGGSGSWNRPGTRTSVYQPGIGRLAKSFTNDTRDTLRYDASGNTTVQQATDTLNTEPVNESETVEGGVY